MSKLVGFVAVIVVVGAATFDIRAAWSRSSLGMSPQDHVRAAIALMGGEQALRAVHAISFKGISVINALEQSTRPSGPWVQAVQQVNEERAFELQALRQETTTRGYFQLDSAEWPAPFVALAANRVAAFVRQGKLSPYTVSFAQLSEESLALDPTQVLLTALAASDLHAEPDTMLHGFAHHVVGFGWQGKPVRIFLSSQSNVLAAIEVTRAVPSDYYLGPWGDVTARTTFDDWSLEAAGVRYPRLWASEINGQLHESLTITQLTVSPKLIREQFVIDPAVQNAFAAQPADIDDLPFGTTTRPPAELASGIVKVPGPWDVTEVLQDDGIVIIEAPISSGYSAKAIADAQERFAGKRVKAVITTSDSWPHIGGIREYAARGIPIYALDLNLPILERMVVAPHSQHPDALARHPRRPEFHAVSRRIVLGSGANRIEIIPYREPTAERQMLVYFPAHKTLYTSDLFQTSGNGWFTPEFLTEAADAVKREKLEVESAWGMHYDSTSWGTILAAIQSASGK